MPLCGAEEPSASIRVNPRSGSGPAHRLFSVLTLRKPLESVNLETKQSEAAAYERSDVCAVPAASVIVQNVVAFEVARALIDKFGGDSLEEMKARWDVFHQLARQR